MNEGVMHVSYRAGAGHSGTRRPGELARFLSWLRFRLAMIAVLLPRVALEAPPNNMSEFAGFDDRVTARARLQRLEALVSNTHLVVSFIPFLAMEFGLRLTVFATASSWISIPVPLAAGVAATALPWWLFRLATPPQLREDAKVCLWCWSLWRGIPDMPARAFCQSVALTDPGRTWLARRRIDAELFSALAKDSEQSVDQVATATQLVAA